jgi:hypothetical protein
MLSRLRRSQGRAEALCAGQDHLVSVFLFKHKPEQCPFGQSLAPGRPQTVGWKPYICTPAQEAAAEGRGMGHLWSFCGSCHDELRSTTFYEPPHDITHRQAGP